MESRDRATAQLSNQETKILHMISQGETNGSIAEALKIEKPTAALYVYTIRRKLGLPHREAMRSLTPEQIEAYRRPILCKPTLTPQQEQVTIFVAQGLSNDEIARKMRPRTTAKAIESHMQRIFKRLGVVSRVQLAIYAIKAGLVKLEDIEIP